MRSRAWAWLLALMALVLAVIPIAAMGRPFGLGPMSVGVVELVVAGRDSADDRFVPDVAPAGTEDATSELDPFFCVACTSTRPSAAAASGSNCEPLHRSISCTAIAGGIAGRCVWGCVIES